MSVGAAEASDLNSNVASAPSPRPIAARLSTTDASLQSLRTTPPSDTSPAPTIRNAYRVTLRMAGPLNRLTESAPMKLASVNGTSA